MEGLLGRLFYNLIALRTLIIQVAPELWLRFFYSHLFLFRSFLY